MLLHIWPENILQFLLNTRMAKLWRRHDGVFSLDELMLHPVVGVLFELLEGLERSGVHSSRILPNCGYHGRIGCSIYLNLMVKRLDLERVWEVTQRDVPGLEKVVMQMIAAQ